MGNGWIDVQILFYKTLELISAFLEAYTIGDISTRVTKSKVALPATTNFIFQPQFSELDTKLSNVIYSWQLDTHVYTQTSNRPPHRPAFVDSSLIRNL